MTETNLWRSDADGFNNESAEEGEGDRKQLLLNREKNVKNDKKNKK